MTAHKPAPARKTTTTAKKATPARKPATQRKPRAKAAPKQTDDTQVAEVAPIVPAPVGVKVGAKRLWEEVLAKYTLRPDEMRYLEHAVMAHDRVLTLRIQLRGMDTMVPGSTGQLVVNPLFAELRQHEAHCAAMLARLKLRDVDAAAGTVGRGTQQREAAKSRWTVPHGDTA